MISHFKNSDMGLSTYPTYIQYLYLEEKQQRWEREATNSRAGYVSLVEKRQKVQCRQNYAEPEGKVKSTC